MMDMIRRDIDAKYLVSKGVPRANVGAKIEMVSPDVLPQVGRYIEKIHHFCSRGIGLFLYGKNGRGKTSVASLVLGEAARYGASGLFVTAEDVRMAHMGPPSKERGQIRYADFLVIDDFGKEFSGASKWGESVMENAIRFRVGELRPTVITTNLSKTMILERYNRSMMHVLGGSFAFIEFNGRDFRKKGVDLFEEAE